MDNRISGLTALDPRVAATERFIQQKKIPPNQVADFLLSMGADPRLAGLVMKYQRLKAESATQPKGPAPATTVAQDIDAQVGLPAAAEAARQPVPTSRGVASIPAPVMERAQFAGGGIVAFNEGGDVLSFGSRDEYESWLNSNKEVQRILRKGPAARTPEENEILRSAGLQLSRRTFAKEKPNIPYADTAPVAKADSGIDFSKMTREQLDTLAKSEDRTMSRAAYGEYLRRSGYRSPGQLLSDAGEGISQFVANTRIAGGAPDYMKDEQGRIRTPGNGGPVTSSFTEGIVPLKKREEVPSAAPAAVTAAEERKPPASFDLMAAAARENVDQTGTAYDTRERRRAETKVPAKVVPPAGTKAETTEEAGGPKDLAAYEKEIADLYESRGIGKATAEYRKFLDEEKARGEKEGKSAKGFALARAGFRMAQEAGKPGGRFLSALGAGGEELAAQMETLRREQQANNRSMREAQFRLAQADELQAAGRIRDAMGLRKDAEARLERAQERAENNAYRYASLASEERRANATLDMQKAVLEARKQSDKDKAGTTLSVALQRANGDLSQDFMYQGLLDKARKAQESGDRKAYDKAIKDANNYKNQFLAPILTEMASQGIGGDDSGAVDWDSL